MPEAIYVEPETLSALAIFVNHFFERMDELNRCLHEIAESLDKIENRLGMATTLDYDG